MQCGAGLTDVAPASMDASILGHGCLVRMQRTCETRSERAGTKNIRKTDQPCEGVIGELVRCERLARRAFRPLANGTYSTKITLTLAGFRIVGCFTARTRFRVGGASAELNART
jgi:hypothetical protein